MIPYADFTYFVLLLYVAVPTLILGLLGRAGWRWACLVTVAMLLLQYHELLLVRAHFPMREIWIVLGFAAWQTGSSEIDSAGVAGKSVWFFGHFLHHVSGA